MTGTRQRTACESVRGMTNAAPELIRAVEVARRYGLPERALYRKVADGIITCTRDPRDRRCRLFSVAELDAVFGPADTAA